MLVLFFFLILGGAYRARQFREGLGGKGFNPGMAMMIKQRVAASQIERIDLVGNVSGKNCIIVDDIIDTAVRINLKSRGLYVKRQTISRRMGL